MVAWQVRDAFGIHLHSANGSYLRIHVGALKGSFDPVLKATYCTNTHVFVQSAPSQIKQNCQTYY